MPFRTRHYHIDVCQMDDDNFSALEQYHRQLRKKRMIFKTVFNYTAPVIAAIAFVFVVNYWTGLEYNVTKTDSVPYFSSTSEAESEETATYSIPVSASKQTITDALLDSANGAVEQTSGLYIDGEFVAASSSSGELQLTLDGILEESKTTPDSTVEFVNDVEVVYGLYKTDTMSSVEDIMNTIDQLDAESATYADSLKDDEKQDNADTSLLSVKETLHITSTEDIPFKTKKTNDKSMDVGLTKVTTEGQNGSKQIVEEVVLIDGTESSREIIEETILKEPVTKQVLVGTKISINGGAGAGNATGSFMWPLAGGVITSSFGPRWGTTHAGIDIGASRGTSIFASDGGTVELARWYGGYGYAIIINHGNGYKTLYGHCSQLIAKAGQKVSKGQLIARVGSTGNSTGPHLHFEVIDNGSKKNPLNYVER